MPSPRRTRSSHRARPTRRWPGRVVVFTVLVLVVLWVGAVAALLLRAYSHLRDGQSAVTTAQAGMKASTVTDPSSPDLLGPVHADFSAARRELDSPLLAPVRVMPVLGRQLRSVRTLAGAAEQVSAIGQRTIDRARAALRAPHTEGPQRVTEISTLAAAASDADKALATISLGPDRALLPFIHAKRVDFARRLEKVQSGLHRGAVAADTAAGLIAGPRHLLLLAANNAEMRSGSGMFLSATTLDFEHGNVTIGKVQDTGDLLLATPSVPFEGDLAARWGFLLPNQEWRNLALSPRFDTSAALAAQMWKARTGEAVDGVLVLDVEAVHALITATGPVQAGGRLVAPDNVVQLLLHDQYNDLQTDTAGHYNAARREQLGTIASTLLKQIEAGHYDANALASGLSKLVGGRHLLLWSAHPAEQQAWTTAGVGGVLDASRFMVSVMNRGSNKLDQFLDVATSLNLTPTTGGVAVTATVHLTNRTPPGQVSYVAGRGTADAGPGDYYGYVQVSMPPNAMGVTVDRRPVADVSGPDGPTEMVADLRTVRAGQSLDVVVSFTVPQVHGQLQVESAARIPAATLTVTGATQLGPVADELRPRISW